MKKLIPEKRLTDIAFTPKGTFLFKVATKKEFYPYELLNYMAHESIILPLQRTAKNMHSLLYQHGYNLNKTHFIDVVAKNIDSPFSLENATYAQATDLQHIAQLIEQKVQQGKKGVKTVFIHQIDHLVVQHGELKTLRFIDFLMKRLEHLNARTMLLANYRRITKNMGKFLFTRCHDVIEMPE